MWILSFLMKVKKFILVSILLIAVITILYGVFRSKLVLPLSENTFIIKTGAGDVPVKDFYKSSVQVDPQRKDALVKRTQDYDIVYFAKDQSFLITLSRQPVKEARNQAELDLLETLGISKDEACKLKVSLKIPFDIDNNLAGKDFHLRFCPNGRSF